MIVLLRGKTQSIYKIMQLQLLTTKETNYGLQENIRKYYIWPKLSPLFKAENLSKTSFVFVSLDEYFSDALEVGTCTLLRLDV